MAESGRFRTKRYNFSMVPNDVLHNPELSTKAKGLYAIIQSLITRDNDVFKWQVKQYCAEGETAFRSMWQELKAKGYLKVYRSPTGEKNTFVYEYELLEIPDVQTSSVINLKPTDTL